MLGICRKVTPYANVMKLGTVGPVGYVIALTAVGPHRLTGFGVSRHPSWVPAIDKAHRALPVGYNDRLPKIDAVYHFALHITTRAILHTMSAVLCIKLKLVIFQVCP